MMHPQTSSVLSWGVRTLVLLGAVRWEQRGLDITKCELGQGPRFGLPPRARHEVGQSARMPETCWRASVRVTLKLGGGLELRGRQEGLQSTGGGLESMRGTRREGSSRLLGKWRKEAAGGREGGCSRQEKVAGGAEGERSSKRKLKNCRERMVRKQQEEAVRRKEAARRKEGSSSRLGEVVGDG
jgi:hypothetical protein